MYSAIIGDQGTREWGSWRKTCGVIKIEARKREVTKQDIKITIMNYLTILLLSFDS